MQPVESRLVVGRMHFDLRRSFKLPLIIPNGFDNR